VGQIAGMVFLGALSAILLWIIGVPYWLTFGVFTGAAAIVPFFGSLTSTVIPALFVLGDGGLSKVLLVIIAGIVVHLIEGNLVSPLIFERQVKLPPVLTVMSVLIMGKLLGPIGLVVAVPTLLIVTTLVRRILIERI
jgi:predicted PurR-regulated permease PerM